MFKDPTFRKSIIASIIASLIFVIFLNPILSLIWDAVLFFGTNLYNGLIDRTYSNAALGQRNWYSFILLISLGILGHGMFTTMLIRFRKLRKKNKILGELELLENKENIKPEDLASVENQVLKMEGADNQFVKFMESKTIAVFLVAFYVLASLVVLQLLTGAYVDLQINTSYKQRSTVLAPFMTDQEEEQLNAKWAGMETRTDYLSIIKSMDSIAQKNNVVLPEVLMK